MTLYGKGYYIWQIPKCDGGIPSAITAAAVEAGLSHVLIKIADGPHLVYNYDEETETDLVPPVLTELRNAGIQVWGWHYVKGDDPIGEAHLGISRTLELKTDGYVIDAESEYKETGKEKAAELYMRQLREGLYDLPIALSTYRYPRLHSALPFAQFLERCDYAMPQVYFEKAHNPEEQLDRCLEQYMSLVPARPVIPTAPTYAVGDWRPTPDEIQRFLQHSRELGLTAANAWSWDFARRPKYMDLWDAVADFDWPPVAPVADIPERLIDSMNEYKPGRVAALYARDAAHVTGTRTIVGRPAIRAWYQTLLRQLLPRGKFVLTGKSGTGNTRHFTWKAYSGYGDVHNGSDTLGLLDGMIQYHYSYFTLTEPEPAPEQQSKIEFQLSR
jgi:hypothetical protein